MISAKQLITFALTVSLLSAQMQVVRRGKLSFPGAIAIDLSSFATCTNHCTSDQVSVTMNATAGTFVKFDVFWCVDSGCTTTPLTTDITISDGTNTYDTNQFCQGTVSNSGLKVGRKQFIISSKQGGSLTTTVQFGSGLGYHANLSWVSVSNTRGVDPNGNFCGTGTVDDPALTTAGNLNSSNSFIISNIWCFVAPTADPTSFTNLYTTGSHRSAYLIGGTAGSGYTVTWPTLASDDYSASVVVLLP